MMARRFVRPLSVVAALAVSVAAQEQRPVFRSGTQVVEIDVRVFDREGRFVRDLTRDDFEVIEDGQLQPVSTFFYVDDPGTVASGKAGTDPVPSPLPPAEPRPRQTWIFFFDLNHLTPGGGFDRARKAVEDFIRDRFRDGDVGGIVAGEKMVNNRLTSVRAELLAGMKDIKPRNETRTRSMEMTRDWPRFLDEDEVVRAARNEGEVVKRVVSRACSDDPDYCRMGDPEPQVRSKAIRLQQDMHRSTLLTLRAIDALSNGLSRIPGPKTIVLLSDGFVVQEIETTLRNVVGQVARSGARIYGIDVRGLNRSPGAANVTQLQADDPYGAVTRFDNVADAPNSLAIDTGGMMIRNENNIGRALETIAADSNRYYVLGFAPSNTTWDGKYRSLQVRVKRDGLRVRARKGYLALEPSRMTVPKPIDTPAPKDETEAPPTPPVAAPPDPVSSLPTAPTTPPAVPATGVATGEATEAAAGIVRMRPDAEARVRELAAGDASSAAKLAEKGWAAYQRGDVEAAIGPLAEAAALPGVRPWVLYALGLSQGALGRPKEAIASWERVRAAAPDFEPVYIDLAATHASLSDLTRALAVLRDAEQRWPNDPEIHNAIGVIHFRRGALDEAIAAFTRAGEVAPSDSLSRLNLARAYELRFTRSRRYVTSQRRWVVDEGDRRKAIEYYEAYLKLGGPYENAARDGLSRLEWSK